MSETNTKIECPAFRRGRSWVASASDLGAYGCGRTLKLTRQSLEAALALLGITAEVVLVPVTAELEQLRAAHDAYTGVLRTAVKALALRKVAVRDIAEATGASTKEVQQLLAAVPDEPEATAPDEPGPQGQEAAGPSDQAASPAEPGPERAARSGVRAARRAAGTRRAARSPRLDG